MESINIVGLMVGGLRTHARRVCAFSNCDTANDVGVQQDQRVVAIFKRYRLHGHMCCNNGHGHVYSDRDPDVAQHVSMAVLS